MKSSTYLLISLFLILSFTSTNTYAQNGTTQANLSEIATKESTHKLMYFLPEKNIKLQNLTQQYKAQLSLGEKDELKTTNSQLSSNTGWTHHRLDQYHQGIKVEGVQLIAHENNGKIQKANGNLLKGMNKENTQVNIDEAVALQTALNFIGAQEYAWETNNEALKGECPTAELCWYDSQYGSNPDQYQLAYKLPIYAISPLQAKAVYIDANTGEVLGSMELAHHQCQGPAGNLDTQGMTLYNGEQEFNTSFNEDNNLYYLENCVGGGVVTRSSDNSGDLVALPITDADNYWEGDPTAVSAHWAAEKTYEVYKGEFSRKSYDGTDGKVRTYVHFGVDWNNAVWYQNQIICGDGDGELFDALVDLDIIAHEFTHGVTQYTSKLIYQFESGALNESFSDIFGTYVESKTISNWNWQMAENSINGFSGLRDMANPSSDQVLVKQPDTYLGNFWYTGSEDNGGVHINSGVQNYWFYLLSEGGQVMNDFGDEYGITGIGIDKAAQIAYKTLTEYLFPSATYVDARELSIEAAKELFGAGSAEAGACEMAWCAVGLGACNAMPQDDKSLTVVFPNGNEQFFPGETVEVQWTSEGTIEQVRIDYSGDGGVTYKSLFANVPNSGSFSWIIDEDENTDIALVKIAEVSNNSLVSDVSDAPFSIKPAVVEPGCTLEASFEIVAAAPYCQATAYQFLTTCEVTENATYEWTINGLLAADEKDPVLLFDSVGTNEVVLTINDGDCMSTTAMSFEAITVPSADFTHVNNELTVSFFPTDGNATSYIWTFNGSNQSNEQSPVYTFDTFGPQEVCLETINECGASQECLTFETIEDPAVDPCSGETVQEEDSIAFSSTPHRITAMIQNKDYILTSSWGGVVKWNFDGTYEKFTTKDGLANTLNIYGDNMVVDEAGNVWFVTGRKLHKYNDVSNTIEYFDNDQIMDVTIASDGTIWCIEQHRYVYRFNGTDFEKDNLEELGITTNEFMTIYADKVGRVWIATTQGEIITYTAENGYEQVENNIEGRINDIIELVDGSIWIGTQNEGIHTQVFNGNQFSQFTEYPDSLDASLFELNGNTTYFKGNNAIYGYDGNELTELNVPFWTGAIGGISVNENNDMYLGIGGAGIYAYSDILNANAEDINNQDNWTNWNTNDPILSSYPCSIINGPNEQIYLDFIWSTNVATFDGTTYENWAPYQDLNMGQVTLVNDADNNLYILSENDGEQHLRFYDGTTLTDLMELPPLEEIKLVNVYDKAGAVDSQGRLYIVGIKEIDGNPHAFGGVWRYDNGTLEEIITPDELQDLRNMEFDLDGTLWIAAGEYGLAKYTEANGLEFLYPEEFPYVHNLAIMQNGNVLINKWDVEMYEYDGESLIDHSAAFEALFEDPQSEPVSDLLIASTADLWVAFKQEVARYNFETQTIDKYYTAIDGYNYTNVMIEDAEGNIWTSGWGGINQLILGEESTDNTGDIEVDFIPPSSDNLCVGKEFTINNITQGATSFEWLVDEVFASSEENLTYAFETEGTHTITLYAYNDAGCDASISKIVQVLPAASQFAGSEDLAICTGQTVVLEAGTDQMAFYFWDLNGDLLGTNSTLTITEESISGTYVLSMIDQCGGTATKEFEIVISDEVCEPESEPVWPGDVNFDGIVNRNDILFYGLAYGSSGPERPDASINWEAQVATPWADSQQNGINYKHADTNGDGVVNLADPMAIAENYSFTHQDAMGIFGVNGPSIFSLIPQMTDDRDTIINGTLMSVRTVELRLKDVEDGSDASLPAYGFAGAVNFLFSDPIIQGLKPLVDVKVDFSNSCMGQQTGFYGHAVVNKQQNSVEFGMTRTDYQNVICDNGVIATMQIVIDDHLPFGNIGDQLEVSTVIELSGGVSVTHGMTSDFGTDDFNYLAPVSSGQSMANIIFTADTADTSTSIETDLISERNTTFDLYPNPANDYVKISVEHTLPQQTMVEITNATGQLMYRAKATEVQQGNILHINTSELTRGIYTVTISDNIQINMNKKLVLID